MRWQRLAPGLALWVAVFGTPCPGQADNERRPIPANPSALAQVRVQNSTGVVQRESHLAVVVNSTSDTPSVRRSGRRKPLAVCGDGLCSSRYDENFRNCPGDCGSLDDRADFLKASLESASFRVDEGLFTIFEAADCAGLDHCWANNPTSPYGIFRVPLAPDEPDPDPEDRGMHPPGQYSLYRLQPDEALIWVGTTPPECPYYSFTAYVFSRLDPDARGDPPYDDRVEVYASLGDSQNHLTLNTSAQPGETSFEKESIVIVTADQGVDQVIRSTLDRAGFSESIANTLVLPLFQSDGVTPLVRMGYDNEDDLFNVLMRIADPEVSQPGTPIRNWLDDPGARMFRIRPEAPGPLDPYPLPALRTPGTGEAESAASLKLLVQRIEDAYSTMDVDTRITLASRREDGYRCLDNLTQCRGDCRDTAYMGTGTAYRLGDDPEALIVAGRNHVNTGKASYVNITPTRASDKKAFYAVVMSDLVGSADDYIPSDPDRENLWQVKFARSCHGEPFCFEITEEQVPRGDSVRIVIRAYLEPATRTSPKVKPLRESELVFPRVIEVK